MKKKILVAENSEFEQMLIEQTIPQSDFEIQFVENGIEALEALNSGKMFDIILLNIEMPKMDGLQTVKLIRQTMPANIASLPVIAITSFADERCKSSLLKAGFDDLLDKPFSKDYFIAIIERLVNRNKQPKHLYDLQYLLDFANGDETFLREMLQLFILEAPITVFEIRKNYTENNWKLVRDKAHRFNPQLAFLGLKDLSQKLYAIEECADSQQNTEQIPELLHDIEQITNQVITALKQDFKL